jgi:hypothetical protein
MNQETTRPQSTTNRERAVIEAGRLIDSLHAGDAEAVKDAWYQVNKYTRLAIQELRAQEPPRPHWTDARKKLTDVAGVG